MTWLFALCARRFVVVGTLANARLNQSPTVTGTVTAAAFAGGPKPELLPVTLNARDFVNAVAGSSCANEPPPSQKPLYFQLLTTSR